MKPLLLALALLAASPVAAAACEVTLDATLKGIPTELRIVLSQGEMTQMRALAEAAGREIPAVVVQMVAVEGPLTQETVVVGLDKDSCVNGAAVVSARTWAIVHGVGA